MNMQIEPIAFFESPLKEKFGVPRQSGVVGELRGHIVFTPKYAVADAFRGLEGFDYAWIIWGFHKAVRQSQTFKPTVRPPRLGGNVRLGVFATRSPFRPNNLGLSSVRLGEIANGRVEVFGADLMDGTPIFDLKPYLPYVDSHPNARAGFTDTTQWQLLEVNIPDKLRNLLTDKEAETLKALLEQDPRPHYKHDGHQVYGMAFNQYNVKFTIENYKVKVLSL